MSRAANGVGLVVWSGWWNIDGLRGERGVDLGGARGGRAAPRCGPFILRLLYHMAKCQCSSARRIEVLPGLHVAAIVC